jgi:hypothetical protein
LQPAQHGNARGELRFSVVSLDPGALGIVVADHNTSVSEAGIIELKVNRQMSGKRNSSFL